MANSPSWVHIVAAIIGAIGAIVAAVITVQRLTFEIITVQRPSVEIKQPPPAEISAPPPVSGRAPQAQSGDKPVPPADEKAAPPANAATSVDRSQTPADKSPSAQDPPIVSKSPTASRASPVRGQSNGIVFDSGRCNRKDDLVTCSAVVKNTRKETAPLNLCGSYVIDDSGTKYAGSDLQVQFGRFSGACNDELGPEVALKASMVIRDIDPTAQHLSLVFVGGGVSPFRGSVTLKDVQIR